MKKFFKEFMTFIMRGNVIDLAVGVIIGGAFTAIVTALTIREEGDEIFFEVTGNGFLYNMVRIMVGTLYYVGIGKLRADDLPEIILSGDRERAGKTMPPEGLYLKEVRYGLPEES